MVIDMGKNYCADEGLTNRKSNNAPRLPTLTKPKKRAHCSSSSQNLWYTMRRSPRGGEAYHTRLWTYPACRGSIMSAVGARMKKAEEKRKGVYPSWLKLYL